MAEVLRRRAAMVAAVLAVDGVLHVYWSTGLTWPAGDARSLSYAVLGGQAPFTPMVVLPLAVALFAGAATVYGCVRLRGRRWGPVLAAACLLVAVGFLLRALAGLVWVAGVGIEMGSAFYWLNLFGYTPLCLAAGLAAVTVAWNGLPGPLWARWTALAVPVLLTGVLLYGAYGYQPSQRGDRSRGATSRFVDTPVARFHYLKQGKGTPVVLLSPGASPTFAWQAQLAVLAGTHTVYVVDLPGQGLTELHDRGFRFDLAGITTAIRAFLDAVGVPVATLGGNSWSGGWALAFAQRYSQRVDRLLLLAPSGLAESDRWDWEAMKLPVIGELFAKLGAASRAATAATVREMFVHKDLVTDEVIDAIWRPATRPDNVRATYELERGLDWRITEAALPRTRQPTLVVWGAQDTVLPVAQAARFGRLMPDARVRVLDGCGHALTLDCPDQVATLMGGFLGDR
jgi:pimeloyl-ACP methyl ester carboxylesterase